MKVGVLTISDGCAQGLRKDQSGDALVEIAMSQSWELVRRAVVPDDVARIQEEVLRMIDEVHVDLVLTTGGTGLGPRDVTPEAIKGLMEKELAGFGELMRHESAHHNQKAWLSRSMAGARDKTLIVCLPGSPSGAKDMLGPILQLIPHAVDILRGGSH